MVQGDMYVIHEGEFLLLMEAVALCFWDLVTAVLVISVMRYFGVL